MLLQVNSLDAEKLEMLMAYGQESTGGPKRPQPSFDDRSCYGNIIRNASNQAVLIIL